MELNQDQKAVVERVVNFATVEDALGITVVGPGGSGKTTGIMEAVQQLLDAGLKVLFCAPTNKAVKQLEKSARQYELTMDNVAFQTVHSALGLAMLPTEDQKYAVRVGRGVMGAFDVVVADEASMLGRRVLFEHLLPDAQEHHLKLVFMGDDMQLPPPKETISPVFTEFEVIRLERIMRQAEGSEILSTNGLLRTAMLGDRPFKSPESRGEQVHWIKDAHFLKTVVDSFDLTTDLDSQRVLAWTNRRVNDVNNAIRKKIFGDNPPRFCPEERVVTGGPLRGAEGEIMLGTDEECYVHHVRPGYVLDEDEGFEYAVHQLVLKPIFADAGQVIANVIHDDEKDRYYQRLEDLATAAKKAPRSEARSCWARFWALKELFADIRYCYCITVHRSQGSTFDKVYVDVKDILRNNKRTERQRLLYVAYSRPRTGLLVNKAKYVA